MQTSRGVTQAYCAPGPSGKAVHNDADCVPVPDLHVAVRLSVSVFGLTYDLNDDVETEYPIMATDFGSVESFQYNSSKHQDYMIETGDFTRPYYLAQGV